MNDRVTSWLIKVPGKRKAYVAALAVLQAGVGSLGAVYAFLLREIVDSAVARDTATFWRYVVFIGGLVAFRLGLNACIRWLSEYTRSSMENCFKLRLTESILTRDYASVSAIHSGEWMNRLTNDAKVVADGATDILPGLLETAVRLLAALVMIVILDTRFAYILIPGGILLVFLTWAFRKVLKKLHKDIQIEDGRLRVFLQERIGGLLMIKSFSAEEQTLLEAEAYLESHRKARLRRNRFSNFCNVGFGAAMQGMYLFGAVYCAYGILTGNVTFGTMTAMMQLIAQVQAPFANISGYLPRWYAMLASAERLMEAEQLPPDRTEPAMEIAEVKSFYETKLSSFGLDNVSFRYYVRSEGITAPQGAGEALSREGTASKSGLSKEGMPHVLRDVSFEIRKGEFVAFTGHSGSGKSTALKLLLAVYRPDSGECYLRDVSGEKTALTAAYRRLFAYVPQGNMLLSGTIRDMVTMAEAAGKNAAGAGHGAGPDSAAGTDTRVWDALRIACADEFVRELSEGLDAPLGERGAGLSEGQLQRIAIARAIYSGSPVLLLDESTSALDEQTEARLLENLRTMTDRTVLIVTHRAAAREVCGRMIELEEEGEG